MVGLTGVHAGVAARARLLVEAFGPYGLVITSGRRTAGHQARLIAQGLTAARSSRHLQGTAFDVSFASLTREQALALPHWVWAIVGRYGESLGLRWGGRFTDYDPFHFDAG